ncbi:hypothetical protein D3C81_781930 [compost metagenome]
MTRKRMFAEFEAHSVFNVLITAPVAVGGRSDRDRGQSCCASGAPLEPGQGGAGIPNRQTKPVFIHLPAVTHPQFDSFDVHLDRLMRGKLMLKVAVVTPESVSEGQMIQSMGL